MNERDLQELAPQVLAAVTRRHGRFDLAEDATQEALIAATQQWPEEGVPDNPRGWLIAVATRRLIDALRAEAARTRREEVAFAQEVPSVSVPDEDDTLTLLFLCCHPALSPPSQLALTLRAVGGLTTAQIASAFLVPEATMAQRISRAKATIAGARFELPPGEERAARVGVVLHVLYLIFNEGYTATSGERLQRRELAHEAIRLTRMTRALLPEDGEVAGLLALMLLTQARSGARDRPDGALVPLAEQDRGKWDRALLQEGSALIQQALSRAPLGPYQLQAAIAAVHGEAATAADTDWPQILKLYDLLQALSPSPVVTLNRAVAVAMVEGPRAGLASLDALDDDRRLAQHHRLASVRAHLHEMAGDTRAALAGYEEAARRTTSIPEQRYLQARAERLRGDVENPPAAPTVG
ncbi:sigma-70 family RNA polymerase sigma factor [Solirubrobacter ginsenosidimutans]|uniref:Sigma-70 family RNA polymerase sigma factor n=1 Tax=Solirubrobacter ginsenosidimutans TaxID=490573 RepID=A0A9X3MRJ4_9ACTN|nr:sigma-70 family RNA polymerase sigma factor [Solirubrobacter ginsenosidimutans]MDA0160616.1 sigma-70 family RNA polymerase sigma factor [Solirubrobacter ginsenosidimutans]